MKMSLQNLEKTSDNILLIDSTVTENDLQNLKKTFSDEQIKAMNEEEYHNLLIYIKRQKKAMETYLKKGFSDQYLIVKDSIKVMDSFKEQFENWFSDYNNTLIKVN